MTLIYLLQSKLIKTTALTLMNTNEIQIATFIYRSFTSSCLRPSSIAEQFMCWILIETSFQ